MRYWIRDRGRHGLPLYELVRRVQQVAGKVGANWLIHRASGGTTWQPLLLELSRQRPLPVSYLQIERLARNGDPSLHDLEVECVRPGLRVRFGLYEEAALYVEAPLPAARWILAGFKNIHPSPARDPSSASEPPPGTDPVASHR